MGVNEKIIHRMTVFIKMNRNVCNTFRVVQNNKTVTVLSSGYPLVCLPHNWENWTFNIQSNFNGSNIFGTVEICSRNG